MGTDPIIVFVMPSILYAVWYYRWIITKKRFAILVLVGLISMGLIYTYLPIRAHTYPFVNFGNPQTVNKFFAFIRGEGLNVYAPNIGEINGFTGSFYVFLTSTYHYFVELVINFTPLLIPLLIFGAYICFKINKNLFIFILLTPITTFVFSGLYYAGNQESWYLTNYIPFTIFIGIGFYTLLQKWKFRFIGTIVLLLSIIPLLFWYKTLNRSSLFISSDYIQTIYPTLNENALLIGSGDFFDEISLYTREAAKVRPDVIPITINIFYSQPWYRENLTHTTGLVLPKDQDITFKSIDEYSKVMNTFFAENITKHPIYLTGPSLRGTVYVGNTKFGITIDQKRFKLVPHGLVSELLPKDYPDSNSIIPANFIFHDKNFPQSLPQFRERTYNDEIKGLVDEYALSYESYGDYYLKTKSDPQKALQYYQKALNFSPHNSEIISRLGNYYASTDKLDDALRYFKLAQQQDSKNPSLLYDIGHVYVAQNDIENARNTLRQVLALAPQNSDTYQKAKTDLDDLNGREAVKRLSAPPVPPGWKHYQNHKQNYTISYPSELSITHAGLVTKITNNKNGGDELLLFIYGQQATTKPTLQQLKAVVGAPDAPGILTSHDNVVINGFTVTDNLYVDKNSPARTLDVLLYKKGWGYFMRIYPSNTNLQDTRDKMLKSFDTIK
ncbi:MAG: tetratricopeptide repeat protein [Candidatus Levyibacteriota bacterium]